MACKSVCKLCKRLVISAGVTFAANQVRINLPAGTYLNGEKYCIVVAQAIPDTATINAPVVITIGGGTGIYPLVDRCCRPVTASGIRTRTRYSTRVVTTATGGSFKLLGEPSDAPNNDLPSISG